MVSIIVPNYNHGRYLRQRLESICNLTYRDFECIILDDASEDDSQEIINEYLGKDTRFTFYPSDVNSGSPFIQWNKGVRLSARNLIWIAESDDSCSPEFLEKLVQYSLKHPYIGVMFCQSLIVDEKGRDMGEWKYKSDIFRRAFIMNGVDFIGDHLVYQNVIPNASAVLFRKEKYVSTGMADELLKSNSDWLTWLKMLSLSHVGYTPEPLNNFRRHRDSVIARYSDNLKVTYQEKYDLNMRSAFVQWCHEKNVYLPTKISRINRRFISNDLGNEGLYLFKSGRILRV